MFIFKIAILNYFSLLTTFNSQFLFCHNACQIMSCQTLLQHRYLFPSIATVRRRVYEQNIFSCEEKKTHRKILRRKFRYSTQYTVHFDAWGSKYNGCSSCIINCFSNKYNNCITEKKRKDMIIILHMTQKLE